MASNHPRTTRACATMAVGKVALDLHLCERGLASANSNIIREHALICRESEDVFGPSTSIEQGVASRDIAQCSREGKHR